MSKIRLWHAGAFAGIILSFCMVAVSQAGPGVDRFLIDFGETPSTTATGWNTVSGTQARNTTTTLPLVNSEGSSSSATLRFTDGFNCAPNGSSVNSSGTVSSSLYPSSATADSLYLGPAGGGICTVNDTKAAFVMGGLAANTKYQVKFYASRLGDASNRTTNYSIGSQTVSLNATNNVNGYATITATTSATGMLTVAVEKAATSAAFGYLGVLEVAKSSPPTVSAGSDQTITLPNHQVDLSGSATDNDGIASYAWTETSSGGATITAPGSATTSVTDLAAGTYTFRLTVTDTRGSSSFDDVTVVVRPQDMTACSPSKIAILGSSTAAGNGASPISNSWVNRYDAYLKQLNGNNETLNLAVGGYSTYRVLPADTPRPADRPTSDTERNITAALAAQPDAIIVNLPSNDTALDFPIEETKANYRILNQVAQDAGVPIWFTTTQPRNLDQTGRSELMALRGWIQATYPDRTLDFWSVLANADGTLNAAYSSGDGIHPNNAGHQKLYNRTAGSNILEETCQSAPIISNITTSSTVSQIIRWATDQPASSWVEYGASTAYGQATPETDTMPRVTSHEVTLDQLQLCAIYYYRVHSLGEDQAEQIGQPASFKTPCNQ